MTLAVRLLALQVICEHTESWVSNRGYAGVETLHVFKKEPHYIQTMAVFLMSGKLI